MAGGWGCPHEVDDQCGKINQLPCDPGMKGCVLAGRFVFANDDKNARLREKSAAARQTQAGTETGDLTTADAGNAGLHP